ncbi:unnamed protein product [Cochlearia groenlandica]
MEKQPPSESKLSRLSFPNEFPYEFDSPAFSPGFSSPGDSTETEDESSSDDEEDFLAGLTRRLPLPPSSFITKPEVEASSRLSQLGSFSKSRNESSFLLPSPVPTTSFRGRENAWDVISAAASEVAKLKLYEETHLRRHQNAAFQSERYFHQQQQRLLDQMWLCSSQSRIKILENQRHNGLPNATWQPRHAGAPVKRASAGTGVFLPRRYPTTTSPSESLKKPFNATTPMLQTKVKQTQSLNFDEFVNVGSSLNRFEHECMLARSTLLARQRNLRGVVYCQNQERLLPQDWMY